jgi:hypothetical protein
MKLWKALMIVVLAVGFTAKKTECSYGEKEVTVMGQRPEGPLSCPLYSLWPLAICI